jgi:hypothetical protein
MRSRRFQHAAHRSIVPSRDTHEDFHTNPPRDG